MSSDDRIPRLRVLVLDHTAQEGGAELALLRLVEALREDVTVDVRVLLFAALAVPRLRRLPPAELARRLEPFGLRERAGALVLAPSRTARGAVREELARAVREGFGAGELEAGKKAILEARRLQRAQDRSLVSRLALYAYVGRTFAWDIDLEQKIARLTPEQVSAALRKYLDPKKLAVVFAGDFKK